MSPAPKSVGPDKKCLWSRDVATRTDASGGGGHGGTSPGQTGEGEGRGVAGG